MITQKWVFVGQTRPNKNLDFKRPNWSHLGRTGWDKERRREEKEEEEKRKKESQAKKVWKLTLIMNPMRFGMDIWFCRIIIFPKLGVLLGLHLNPKIMESMVGKNPTWHKMVMESFL